MKSFKEYIAEAKEKHFAMTFIRGNPPTNGHSKVVDAVTSHPGTHRIVVSHSQDNKKNPLSGEEKADLLREAHPEHAKSIVAADKEHPTILHHLAKLHAEGHTHGKVVVGSDRVPGIHELVHKYNGVKGPHGYYNFKHLEVKSAGERDPDAEGTAGISGTKMREFAKKGDVKSFANGMHPNIRHRAKEVMDKINSRIKE